MKSLALVAVAACTLIIPVSVAQTPQGTRDTTTAPTAVTPATPSPTNVETQQRRRVTVIRLWPPPVPTR